MVASNWKQLGSPLRPLAEDVDFFARALREWCAAHPGAKPRALILGVTPELYRLPWPDAALVRAADRTPAMIRSDHPGWCEAAQIPVRHSASSFDVRNGRTCSWRNASPSI